MRRPKIPSMDEFTVDIDITNRFREIFLYGV